MRLTSLLWRRCKLPRGHIFRGKYRLVKQVTPLAAANLRLDYAREEKNMFYLRNPYLSVEQSSGHAKELGKKEKWLKIFDQNMLRFKDHVTIEQRLRHLRVSDAWD